MNTKATRDAQATRDAARAAYISKRYQASTGTITCDHSPERDTVDTWKTPTVGVMGGRVVRDGEHVIANMAIMDSGAALVEVERGESYTDALKRQIRALQVELVQEEKRSKDRQAENEAQTYTPPTSDAQQARSASYDAFVAKRHRTANAWKDGQSAPEAAAAPDLKFGV